jgi:hypothetical protein
MGVAVRASYTTAGIGTMKKVLLGLLMAVGWVTAAPAVAATRPAMGLASSSYQTNAGDIISVKGYWRGAGSNELIALQVYTTSKTWRTLVTTNIRYVSGNYSVPVRTAQRGTYYLRYVITSNGRLVSTTHYFTVYVRWPSISFPAPLTPSNANAQTRQVNARAAQVTSTYGPPRVGCGGALAPGENALTHDLIDVEPNIAVNDGGQWWGWQVTMYKWTGQGWIKTGVSPTAFAYQTSPNVNVVTIGPSVSDEALANQQFTVQTTGSGYYFPETQYAYLTTTGWHIVNEPSAYLVQYTPSNPYDTGTASRSCYAWQDPDGRF